MPRRDVLSLLGLALFYASAPTWVAAQALPDPPPGDRQPSGLTEPRIAPLPEAMWTDEHRALVEQYAGDELYQDAIVSDATWTALTARGVGA